MKTYHSNMARRWVLSLQREGRIIRQGNTNKQVKIFRYVTKNSFDAYNRQILEQKQRFIGQIMTSKSPVRSADDIDEASLSYAEVKALAREKVCQELKRNFFKKQTSPDYDRFS